MSLWRIIRGDLKSKLDRVREFKVRIHLKSKLGFCSMRL